MATVSSRLVMLNPVVTDSGTPSPRAKRLKTLDGIRIGLLANGKLHADLFLDYVLNHLQSAHPFAEVVRVVKPQASRPVADPDLNALLQCAAVISGVGD